MSLIPEDFGSEWAMSDIVLKTLNADGKELHVSKHALAAHSPFFQAMFFGAEWKEKNAGSLELDDDYEVVKEVLRLIYWMGRTFNTAEELFNLYSFADKRDFPMIRQMCKAELIAQPSLETLKATTRLGLRDATAMILSAVSLETVHKYVDSITSQGEMFDGGEVKAMLRKAKQHGDGLLLEEKIKYNSAMKQIYYAQTSRREASHQLLLKTQESKKLADELEEAKETIKELRQRYEPEA